MFLSLYVIFCLVLAWPKIGARAEGSWCRNIEQRNEQFIFLNVLNSVAFHNFISSDFEVSPSLAEELRNG